MNINVAILGASGYGGNELIKILANHPKVKIKYAQSRSSEGKMINEIYSDSNLEIKYSNPSVEQINSCDAVFLALPKEEAASIATKIKTVIIDLSPAHRFDSKYVYGLPEINKEKIKKSNFIANPGCYATACILGILPIAGKKISAIAFDCKSGYSGGGKNKKYEFEENVIPYSLKDHYQKPEVAKFLRIPFSFVPHVVNAFRGLIATIHIFGEIESKDFEKLEMIYKKFYEKEPLVSIISEVPDFSKVNNQPGCLIGGFSKSKDHIVIVSAIDNLLKGAASQAVQNMNIRFAFNEKDGLTGGIL